MARCFIINNSFIITFLFSYSNLCACVCLVCTSSSTHGFHDAKSNRTRLTNLFRAEQTAHTNIFVHVASSEVNDDRGGGCRTRTSEILMSPCPIIFVVWHSIYVRAFAFICLKRAYANAYVYCIDCIACSSFQSDYYSKWIQRLSAHHSITTIHHIHCIHSLSALSAMVLHIVRVNIAAWPLNVYFFHFWWTRLRLSQTKNHTSSNIHNRFVHVSRSFSSSRRRCAWVRFPPFANFKWNKIATIAVCGMLRSDMHVNTRHRCKEMNEKIARGYNYAFTIQNWIHIFRLFSLLQHDARSLAHRLKLPKYHPK